MIWKYREGCDSVAEDTAYVIHAFALLGLGICFLNNVVLILCFTIQISLAENDY